MASNINSSTLSLSALPLLLLVTTPHELGLRQLFRNWESQCVNAVLPFCLLLFRILRPPRVRRRAKNPWRRFRTRWLGRNVLRGAKRSWVAFSAGCADGLGVMSTAPEDAGEDDGGRKWQDSGLERGR